MRTAPFLALLSFLAGAHTEDKPAIRYQPRSDEDRPMPVTVRVSPQEGRLALKVTFDRPPWGEDCKQRCANATLFLDLDDNKATGLQMGNIAETGADLSVNIQGTREYMEVSAQQKLRVKVRQFQTSATSVEDGVAFIDLDQRRDQDHLKAEGNTVSVLIEIAQVDVPAGKKLRVVFHPAGGSAVQGTAPGMLAPTKTHLFP